ncbi:hypothetical protein PG988_009781 [Apiospora saccharicola]
MTAIEREDPILVMRLLQAGSRPEIDFDAWLKGAKLTMESNFRDYESNQNMFADSAEQPLIVTVRSAQPSAALELLKKGADPNVLPKESQRVVRSNKYGGYNTGRTALDIVRATLKALRSYEGEKAAFFPYWSYQGIFLGYNSSSRNNMYGKPPDGPQRTSGFLEQFKDGTYQHLVVSKDIRNRMTFYEKELVRFQKVLEQISSHDGLGMKKNAIADIMSQLQQVEGALVARGAKIFQELHPDIQILQETRDSSIKEEEKPYEYIFSFTGVKDVTEARKAAYIQLFEAAWQGDLDKIKLLTLASWDADKTEPPLKVTVVGGEGNNPFSLAFLKGHYDVAKAILEIAQAQWAPADESDVRYTMAHDNDEECGEGSDEESEAAEPEIFKEIIDGDFTIENIGQVSMQVKSNILAADFLHWTAPTFHFDGTNVEEYHDRESLHHFAMRKNDQDTFNRLVDMGIYFTNQRPHSPNDDETSRIYTFPAAEFLNAIKLGRVDMLSSIIGRTGAGIPLEHLVRKSGASMQVKPRYYQGLTVYGEKRSDWANAGRSLMKKTTDSQVPPLLTAALVGSLASVEWFISDIPMRRYLEFGSSKSARDDPRLKHLSQSPGGFDRAIVRWLGFQNDLVLHCAVMAPVGDDTDKLIRYLIRVCPSSLESKSEAGYTPLFLACLLGREQIAKTLIEGGADQSVKDKQFNNIIHAALTNQPVLEKLRKLLDLLDPELRAHLFVQRNHLVHGGNTPLHSWLLSENTVVYSHSYAYQLHYPGQSETQEKSDNVAILKTLLEYSGGQDLDILNGSGDTVAHSAVLLQLPEQMRVMLEHSPKGLHRENAVGRTPAEMAYDLFLAYKVAPPRDIAFGHHRFSYHNGNDVADKLVKQSPEEFLAQSNQPKVLHKERVWEVVQDFMARFPGKRRLVSLNEANDVARRLGENYSWQRYNTRLRQTLRSRSATMRKRMKKVTKKRRTTSRVNTRFAGTALGVGTSRRHAVAEVPFIKWTRLYGLPCAL